MNERSAITLRLPPEDHRAIAIAAAIEGISVNEWICALVIQAARERISQFKENVK